MKPTLDPTMPLIEAIRGRRAVRSFRPDKVDEWAIRFLLDAAVQAPTAMHLEPWAFAVVQDARVLARISEQAKALTIRTLRNRPVAPGARAEGHLALLDDPSFNIFYDASTLVVICARGMGPYAAADCWLAAENLMLAACALGLGTCCIGFAIEFLDTPEGKAELGVPPDVSPVVPIIVGVPRSTTPPVPRKAPEILSWK